MSILPVSAAPESRSRHPVSSPDSSLLRYATIAAVVLLGVLVLSGASATAAPTPITECGEIDTAGEYQLSGSFTATDNYCLEVTVSDVHIDGQGNELTHPSTGYDGIFAEGSSSNPLTNVSIENIVLEDWEQPIVFEYVEGGSVTNSRIHSAYDEGIVFDESPNGTVDTVETVADNYPAIYVDRSDGVTITNANLTGSDDITLEIYRSLGVTVTNTTVNGTDDDVIEIYDSHDARLSNVSVMGGDYGVYVSGSKNATLERTHVTDSELGLGISTDFYHDIDTSNTVDGVPVYYLKDLSDVTFDGSIDRGFFGIINSTNVTITELARNETGIGFLGANIDGLSFHNNTFADDYMAVSLTDITNLHVRDVVLDEFSTGLALVNTPDAIIENVSVTASSSNSWGIRPIRTTDAVIRNSVISSTQIRPLDSDRLHIVDNDFEAGGSVVSYGSSELLVRSNEFSDALSSVAVNDYSQNSVIEDNVFTGRTSAIYVSQSSGSIVRNNQITGVEVPTSGSVTASGIRVERSGDVLVTNNSIDSFDQGIFLYQGGSGTVVANNSVTNVTTGFGIRTGSTTDTHNFLVTENEFTNVETGFSLYQYMRDARFEKNTLTNVTDTGVSLPSGYFSYGIPSNISITENEFNGVGQYGIRLGDTEDSHIGANTFSNGSEAVGILLENDDGSTVVGNSIDAFGRISGAWRGAIVIESGNTTVHSNVLSAPVTGIQLRGDGSGLVVRENAIEAATATGLFLDHLSGGAVSNNTVTGAADAVRFNETNDTVVGANTLTDSDRGLAFVQNLVNVVDSGSINHYTWTLPSRNVTIVDNNVTANEGVTVTVAPAEAIDNGTTVTVTDPTVSTADGHLIANNVFNVTSVFGVAVDPQAVALTNYTRAPEPIAWNYSAMPGPTVVGGPYLGGNFYATPAGDGVSDTCADTNGDGICDSSLEHTPDHVDHRPLTMHSGGQLPAYFAVSITGDTVVEGENVTVVGIVENGGNTSGTQTVTVEIQGAGASTSEQVTLGTGANDTMSLPWETQPGDAGTYTATIDSANDSAAAAVTVQSTAAVLESISLALDATKLNVSETTNATVTANYSDGSQAAVTGSATYSSDDPSVATVDGSSQVTAVGPGVATITADYQGETDTVSVESTGDPEITLSVTDLDFGTVDVGASRTEQVIVHNVGTGNLTISSVAVSGPDSGSFSLNTGVPASLVSDQSMDIAVTFTPTTAANHSAVLAVESDDPVNGSASVVLTGDGHTQPTVPSYTRGSGRDSSRQTEDDDDTTAPDNDSDPVEPPVLSPAAFEIDDVIANASSVSVGDTIEISATVTNVGDEAGTLTADLTIDGTTIDSASINLAGGESTTVSYVHRFDDVGTYEVAIDGELLGSMTVTSDDDDGSPGPGLVGALAVLLGVTLVLRHARR